MYVTKTQQYSTCTQSTELHIENYIHTVYRYVGWREREREKERGERGSDRKRGRGREGERGERGRKRRERE